MPVVFFSLPPCSNRDSIKIIFGDFIAQMIVIDFYLNKKNCEKERERERERETETKKTRNLYILI